MTAQPSRAIAQPSAALKAPATAALHAANTHRALTATQPPEVQAIAHARPSPSPAPSAASAKASQANPASAATATTPAHRAATTATPALPVATSHHAPTAIPATAARLRRQLRGSIRETRLRRPRATGSFSARPQRNFEDSDRTSGAPRKTFSRDSTSRSEGRAGRADGPPFRKFDAPRSPRPSRAKADFDSKPSSGFGEKKPYSNEKKPYSKTGSSFGAKKPYSKSSEGYARKSSSSSFPKKSGSFAGKKPYSKSAASSTGKPASTFDKFKGNKKPFGKRSPTRKFKAKEGE